MKIAVTYENELVYDHFGHAPEVKIYDVDDEGKIISSNVLKSPGTGHEIMPKFIMENEIDVLITGSIGDPAVEAFGAYDLTIVEGAVGRADEFVAALIAGELSLSESCDGECGGECGCHHEESSSECGCGCHHEEAESECCCRHEEK